MCLIPCIHIFTPAASTTMAAATATMAAAAATIYGSARACVCNNGMRVFSRKTPSRFAQEGLLPNVCACVWYGMVQTERLTITVATRRAKATRRPLVKRGRATRRPHEGHTKATGKTCSFSACARQRVKNCLPSSKRLLWQLWFLKKHMFYQWPSCGLRMFSKWPSCGLRVATEESSEFQGPKASSAPSSCFSVIARNCPDTINLLRPP